MELTDTEIQRDEYLAEMEAQYMEKMEALQKSVEI